MRDLNLGGDILKDFEVRSLIYKNRDVYHENCGHCNSDDNSIVNPETIEACRNIERATIDGRDMLSEKLKEYMATKQKLSEVDVACDDVNESFAQVKGAISKFEHTCLKYDRSSEIVDKLHASLSEVAKIQRDITDKISEDIVELENRRKTASEIIMRLSSTYRVLRSTNIMFTCPICLERQVDRFLMPCGHTYCSTCMCGITDSCPMCRKPIQKIADLYFN
jgi:hypothetical protein